MGKIEADIDGIKWTKRIVHTWTGDKTETVFFVPCCHCGSIIERKSYGRNQQYSCDACKNKLTNISAKSRELKPIADICAEDKSSERFLKAVNALKKQHINIDSRKNAINAASKAADKYGSVPEAMLAIEMFHSIHLLRTGPADNRLHFIYRYELQTEEKVKEAHGTARA